MDADLRKSVLKGRYKTNAARYGLSHYLSGQASISDISCKTNIPDFYVIFSGPVPPNPSELLGNDAFRLLLEYLRKEYVCNKVSEFVASIKDVIAGKAERLAEAAYEDILNKYNTTDMADKYLAIYDEALEIFGGGYFYLTYNCTQLKWISTSLWETGFKSNH